MLKYFKLFLVLGFGLFPTTSFSEINEDQLKMLEGLPPDQRDSIMQKMNDANQLQDDIEEIFKEASTLIKRPELKDSDQLEACEECIYGYDFFLYSPTTFAPSGNIPISSTYVLGPGDKIAISYFGNYQNSSVDFINREGILKLPLLAPVNLLGMTFTDAVTLIENKVETELIGTSVSVSIKDVRSISVYLLGQSYKPGAYTVSGLSTITNALFASGGVNEIGSLRNIQVRRGGKTIKVYDFYDFLLQGQTKSDIRLQDGDVIFIPYIEKKVRVGSGFKGPHLYEVKDGETIRDVVGMAGGISSGVGLNEKLEYNTFNAVADNRDISYFSQNSNDLDRKLSNGDIINISKSISMKAGSIEITGEVNKPGEYSILKGDTILDVINRAGGYTDESFSEGAIFLRKEAAELEKKSFERAAESLEDYMVSLVSKSLVSGQPLQEGALMPISRMVEKLRNEEPLGRQVVNVDYLKLKTDPFLNFRVQKGDFLHIPKRPDSISVTGEVLNPSIQRFSPSISLSEYIDLAGGLKSLADENKIFIVLPSGESFVQKRSLFSRNSSNLLPGSTIVVSRVDYGSLELASVIAPLVASFATSAAAIAVLGRE